MTVTHLPLPDRFTAVVVTMIDITVQLAAQAAPIDGASGACVLCDADDWPVGPRDHDPFCPWARAREIWDER